METTLEHVMNTHETAAAIREQLPHLVPYARIVGRWVWIETPTKPTPEDRAVLKSLKFRWNPKRIAWQCSCGHSQGGLRARNYHPMDKYGADPID